MTQRPIQIATPQVVTDLFSECSIWAFRILLKLSVLRATGGQDLNQEFDEISPSEAYISKGRWQLKVSQEGKALELTEREEKI